MKTEDQIIVDYICRDEFVRGDVELALENSPETDYLVAVLKSVVGNREPSEQQRFALIFIGLIKEYFRKDAIQEYEDAQEESVRHMIELANGLDQ